MNFDTVGNLLLSAFASMGKEKGLALLQKEHDRNEHDYKAILFVLNAAIEHGKTAAGKTSTTLDDNGLAIAQDIIVTSGTKNGVSL